MSDRRTAAAAFSRIDAEGTLTLSGTRGLVLARAILEEAIRAAGYVIVFDPDSDPDLIDHLTVTALGGLEGATLGAGLGTVLGMLFGRPAAGAAIGVGLGLAVGAARGVDRVRSGWRVRAVWEVDGTPSVTFQVARR